MNLVNFKSKIKTKMSPLINSPTPISFSNAKSFGLVAQNAPNKFPFVAQNR